jgi:putative ABC transport system permease protein
MRRFPGFKRFLRIDRGRATVDRAVEDELRFHFDMTMRELMADAMTPDDARRETERRFGDVQRTRERLATIDRSRVDQERRAEWWSAFAQDFRYALRGLRLKPGFALAVIITLALGIGANATMFGIVDRLLFRPPRYLVGAERTGRVFIPRMFRGTESVNNFFSYRRYLDLRNNTTSFDAMTPFYTRLMPIGVGEATRLMTVAVSDADLWRMFDARPIIGRFFTRAEASPTRPAFVFVISYAYWQTNYGGRDDAIGQMVNVGPDKYTIIGVAPDGFTGFTSDPVSGFISTAANSNSRGQNGKIGGRPWWDTYNSTWFEVYARRKTDVTPAHADADLTQAHVLSYKTQVAEQPTATPIAIARPRGFLAPALRARGPDPTSESKVATWLAGVALIVLLIACANVANLLVARALRRQREIAVRLALGVSRGRLLMQLAMESSVLAVIGGALGLVIAQWGGVGVRHALLDQASSSATLADTRLLLFVGALTLATALLTGLAPALQARRTDIANALKAGVREGTVHRSGLRIGLLVGQAALSVVLLIGAGLFVRSLVNVKNVRLGYEPEHLLMVGTNFRGMTLDSTEQKALTARLIDRTRSIPGVTSVSRAVTLPYYSSWQVNLFVPGIDSASKLGDFQLQAGSPTIFSTMGTRILRGRGFTDADRDDTRRVVVVSELMAQKLWPGEDPIGKTFRINVDTAPPVAVIGIAENIRQSSLNEPDAHYYIPVDQFPFSGDFILVRTTTPAHTQTESVRRALQPLLPGVAYVTATPMTVLMAGATRSWRLGATMFGVFGGLALVLAAVGLYSVIAYSVAQRTHEMGVRVALGAQANDVIRLIVSEGLRIVVPGVALGAAVALIAGRWMAPLLFEESPKDPAVVASVVATLIVVAAAASWLPARRASRVDPNEALRAD